MQLHSITMSIVLTFLALLLAVNNLHGYKIIILRDVMHRASKLFASKHKASSGIFLDTIKPARSLPDEKLLKELNLGSLIKSQQDLDAITGSELRKNRDRNLKNMQFLPSFDYSVPRKTRNMPDEQIMKIIQCLNLSYGGKSREELSDAERVGVINWADFDMHADEVIEGYAAEDEKLRKTLNGWIKYHRAKKDIVFDVDTWRWSPRTW